MIKYIIKVIDADTLIRGYFTGFRFAMDASRIITFGSIQDVDIVRFCEKYNAEEILKYIRDEYPCSRVVKYDFHKGEFVK